MPDFKQAKVGDKVYSLLYGEGIVLHINYLPSYPIQAEFMRGRKSFNHKGYHDNQTNNPVVFWSKPIIIESGKTWR